MMEGMIQGGAFRGSSNVKFVESKVDLDVNIANFKKLNTEETYQHLDNLSMMVGVLSEFVLNKLPKNSGIDENLLSYLVNIRNSLIVYSIRNKIESAKPNADVAFECSIDPTDSGFPLFIRDFKFLENDKRNADENYSKFRNDEEMVDRALFTLFRSNFPKEMILEKMLKDYYGLLVDTKVPREVNMLPLVTIKKEGGLYHCKKPVERFHDNDNIPRFYNFQFRVPEKSFEKEGWKAGLEAAINEGFRTVANLEMPYLAKRVEEVDGVMLDSIRRYDMGPFYNRFTINNSLIQEMIDEGNPDDSIITFREFSIFRAGEKKKAGFANMLKAMLSGDYADGVFTQQVASPLYVIMPHRFIQKINHRGLDLFDDDNIKMYGIKESGSKDERSE